VTRAQVLRARNRRSHDSGVRQIHGAIALAGIDGVA
jgi:hypothetical protein